MSIVYKVLHKSMCFFALYTRYTENDPLAVVSQNLSSNNSSIGSIVEVFVLLLSSAFKKLLPFFIFCRDWICVS